MGIVNVTPDSFFPARAPGAHDEAIARGRRTFRRGAATSSTSVASRRARAPSRGARRGDRAGVPTSSRRSRPRVRCRSTRKRSRSRARRSRAGASVAQRRLVHAGRGRGRAGRGLRRDAPPGRRPRPCRTNPTYDDVVGEIGGFLADVAARARDAGRAASCGSIRALALARRSSTMWPCSRTCDHFVDTRRELRRGRADRHEPQAIPR